MTDKIKTTQAIHVRGVEIKPWREARAEALRQSKTNGQWLSEAIKGKLSQNSKHHKS